MHSRPKLRYVYYSEICMQELWKTKEKIFSRVSSLQIPRVHTHTHTHTHTHNICVNFMQGAHRICNSHAPRELYWRMKMILRSLNKIDQARKMDRRRYAKFRRHLLIEVFPL